MIYCASERWSLAMERKLLTLYHDRVYLFNNDHVDNSVLWKEIVQVSVALHVFYIYNEL